MNCPRCKKDTALVRMKVNRDGTDAFLCGPCGQDWTSIASFFGRKWWDVYKPQRADNDVFHGLFGLFLKSTSTSQKSYRKDFAKTAVFCLSRELDKYQAVALELDQEIVTRADYAWIAGMFDRTGMILNKDQNPASVRVRELVGSEASPRDRRVMVQIEPYLRCYRSPVQVAHCIRNENWLSIPERQTPEAKKPCHRHPKDIAETETTYAYLAGIFELGGMVGHKKSRVLGVPETDITRLTVSIRSNCKWMTAAFEAVYGGDLFAGEGGHVWVLEDQNMVGHFLETVGPYVMGENAEKLAKAYFSMKGRTLHPIRKMMYNRKLRRHLAEAVLPPYGGGEGREPNGTTAGTERPAPTSLNRAGFESRGGDATLGRAPAGGGGAKSSSTLPAGKPAMIRLSSPMRKKIAERSRSCVLCKKILDTGPEHVLKGDKEMPLRAKAFHLAMELGHKIEAPCSVCGTVLSAGEWTSDDMSLCPSCLRKS